MNGIYGYWDNIKGYVAYIGIDKYIVDEKRDKHHNQPSRYDEQKINQILQNNPGRYDYFKLAEGNFSEEELNEMEIQAIGIFKTFKYDYPERSVFNFTKGGKGRTGFKSANKTKKTLSEQRNSTGFFRVTKENDNTCSQKFRYKYQWLENGKHKSIKRVSLNELEKEVKNRNLEWTIIDEDKAKKTLNFETNKIEKSYKNNTTGISCVSIVKKTSYKKGFGFVYSKLENGKKIRFERNSLKSLKEEVKKRGYDWIIVNKDKMNKTLKLDNGVIDYDNFRGN